ncbi:MAG: AI-2E family transporter [Aestuariivita sp.]|nr:AI-2E family transporter [Aestuariivita sp.]MCY4203237.1 AI-2E family transporter [Aestuariivita sp.]MCY4287580.1 AI-2E family transporter [Aestuariivita sp.]MCY4346070.1 AI-2E family transporter [Aestuariivita sp.]
MALPVKVQLQYWGGVFVALTLTLWFLGDVLMPFVIGGAIAYFLDPVADRLEAIGLSRILATALIAVISLVTFVLIALVIIPALLAQTTQLFEVTPQLFDNLQAFLRERFPSLLDESSLFRQTLLSLGEIIQRRGDALLDPIINSAASFLNFLFLLVIVPVVAVYMLLDWDRLTARVDDLLPRDHAPIVRRLAAEIDQTMASFVRGMGTVCLILGTYYAISLMLVGLQFGLVVGFFAGLITFIPYLGALLGGVLAIGLGLFQFWGDWISLGLVAGIFLVGQIIEGNILTPRLVGSSVGLHPVWLLVALSVFGALFGFIGLLVAVPVAAALGVITKFGLSQYTESRLYRGLSDREEP